VAAAFLELGASLILVDRRRETVDERLAGLGTSNARVRGFACDLADPAAVDALVADVRAATSGRVSALVHMAGGFAMSGPVAESSLDVWDRQLSINLRTAYLAARGFLPLLRASKEGNGDSGRAGALVFFASQAALPGSAGADMTAYAIAKTGVVTLMRAIAAEERKNGVRANAVAPSSIRTAANIQSMGDNIRYVEREEVASVVTFLCSDAASAVSGQVIALA
jgi:NAD(P)-dependent dehydrogenase (short-subunit alcohol dehydrogenase family)